MFTIKENVQDELIINKSKFLTYVYKINSVECVINNLNNLKKIHKDANHYCYAYSLKNIKKASDDGEPLHTAGLPILNVIENKKLDNVLVVVVRYFGGIKLGAGGLVRAYTNATKNALIKAEITPIKEIKKVRITFDYNNVSNVNYLLKDNKITYKEYDDNVIYEFEYEENKFPKQLDNYIINKTNL